MGMEHWWADTNLESKYVTVCLKLIIFMLLIYICEILCQILYEWNPGFGQNLDKNCITWSLKILKQFWICFEIY